MKISQQRLIDCLIDFVNANQKILRYICYTDKCIFFFMGMLTNKIIDTRTIEIADYLGKLIPSVKRK